MANAADYLQIDKSTIETNYKLRTRSVGANNFVATNTSANYILTVNISANFDGVSVSPAAFTLQPNQAQTVAVNYDTSVLETLSAGTQTGTLSLNVTANTIQVSTPASAVRGCTDINALNYNPNATINDGSCIAKVSGCTDRTALNFNANANINDGSCQYRQSQVVVTVTPSSNNFGVANQSAQYLAKLTVDGQLIDATFGWSTRESSLFNVGDTGAVTATKSGKYTDIITATVLTPIQYKGISGTATAIADIGGATADIYGCTNPAALNYNSRATKDDGSCIAKVFGCTDNTASNYNPQANVDDGSCRQAVYTLQLTADTNTINPGEMATITGVVLKDGVLQPDIVVNFNTTEKYIPFESAQALPQGGPAQQGPVVTATTTTVSGNAGMSTNAGSGRVGLK